MRDNSPSIAYDRASSALATASTSLEERFTELLPSQTEQPASPALGHNDDKDTVLYLAYGSNLSAETFKGNRGIKPLSQINVQVPSLRLTFDLPGIPYIEPCFANTARRDPAKDKPEPAQHPEKATSSSELNISKDKYRKDRWHKGLIGVVYEVTREDYAHIIATEGGGTSYQDILVDCYPLNPADQTAIVPQTPTTTPFKAHTLFAPALPPGDDPPSTGGRVQRPDSSYAQSSARYLKLMTDGAAEHCLPYEYQDYLLSLRPYTITTWRQRAGQSIALALWLPLIMMVFGLGKIFAGENGRHPQWLRELTLRVFAAVWASYDVVFKKTFGDGERTLTDIDEDGSRFEVRRGRLRSVALDPEKGRPFV